MTIFDSTVSDKEFKKRYFSTSSDREYAAHNVQVKKVMTAAAAGQAPTDPRAIKALNKMCEAMEDYTAFTTTRAEHTIYFQKKGTLEHLEITESVMEVVKNSKVSELVKGGKKVDLSRMEEGDKSTFLQMVIQFCMNGPIGVGSAKDEERKGKFDSQAQVDVINKYQLTNSVVGKVAEEVEAVLLSSLPEKFLRLSYIFRKTGVLWPSCGDIRTLEERYGEPMFDEVKEDEAMAALKAVLG